MLKFIFFKDYRDSQLFTCKLYIIDAMSTNEGSADAYIIFCKILILMKKILFCAGKMWIMEAVV